MVVVPESEETSDRSMLPSGRPITNGLANPHEVNDNGNSSLTNAGITQLDQLLEQVKTLKLENSTLKNELSNNTSQINRLESEASNLKEMVIRLGSSIAAQPQVDQNELEPRTLPFGVTNRVSSYHNPLSPYKDYGLPCHTSFTNNLFDVNLPSTSNHREGSTEIHRRLQSLTSQKELLLESLKREECAKDEYMKQLKDLNESLLASEKTMSPNSVATRKQLDQAIHKVQEAMKQKLGTPEMMEQRVQNWLHRLKVIEQEIQNIRYQYGYIDRVSKTTKPKQVQSQDFGLCERSKSQHRSGKTVADVIMQTGQCGSLEILPDDVVSQAHTLFECGEKISMRSTQTILTAVSAATHLFRRQDRSGSVSSLPDRIGINAAQTAENHHQPLPPKQHLIIRDLDTIENHCQSLHNYLQCHAECVKSLSDKGGKEVHKLRQLQMEVQISEILLRAVEQIMQLSYDQFDRMVLNHYNCISYMAKLLILICLACKETKHAQNMENHCVLKPIGFTLINLLYGDQNNKTMLINMKGFLEAIIEQLKNKSEEIQQVMASILRNLSWQADPGARDLLRQKGSVGALMSSVMSAKREETLKSMLGALWNLSGHGNDNRVDICSIEGALSFLVSTLSYRSPSKRPEVVECGSGALRNISNVIAANDEYRKILRKHHCLQQLLHLLSSPSLTIVSNACSTLWNLSARDVTDQQILRDLGAIGKLRKLALSRHEAIAHGSAAALRNLLQNQPEKAMASLALAGEGQKSEDMPSLQARKLKQMEAELKMVTSSAQGYSESCDVNFSPRHVGRSNYAQPSSHTQIQRDSLMGNANQSPKPRGSQHPGIFHSGSLGSIPHSQPDPHWPTQAWGAHPNDVGIYHPKSGGNTFPQSVDSRMLHSATPYSTFPIDMSSHARVSEQHSNVLHASLPRPTTALNTMAPKPSRTWGQSGAPQAPRGLEINPSVLSPPRMPGDLEEKLRHVDEEFEMLDDDDVPVDYSLKFTDDMSRTPAPQSPRTDVYPNRSFHQAPNKPQTVMTSSLPKTAPLHMPNTTKSTKVTPKVGFSANETVLLADDDMYAPEETPTNFGARYAEENEVYRHINDSYEQRVYEPSHDLTGRSDEAQSDNKMQNPEVGTHDGAKQDPCDENDEDVDKFELNSGLMTPGQLILPSRTPIYNETPMMFSRQSSPSLLSEDPPSPHSEVASDPGSRLVSGWASESDLPDSPGQSMPVSRQRSLTNIHEASNRQAKTPAIHPPLQLPASSSVDHTAAERQKAVADSVKRVGYMVTLPPSDEMKLFSDEPAMSEMTAFSGLTIDNEKVAPLGNVQTLPTAKEAPEDEEETEEKKDAVLDKVGRRAIKQAGYTTSLPTNDEIKHFTNEGTISMASLSEISALRDHNDGFIRGGRSPNRNSFTSRSSATGASIPNAPITSNGDRVTAVMEGSSGESKSSVSDSGSPEQQDVKDILEDDDSSSLGDAMSDDEDLLMECINNELRKPSKKKSLSSRSTRSQQSSRTKEKTNTKKATTPAPTPTPKPLPAAKPVPVKPVRSFNVKETIAAADSKLNGMGIVQYIDSKMGEDVCSSPEPGGSNPATMRSSADVNQQDADNRPSGREVIQTVETLNETYSVKKHLKANEKQNHEPVTSQRGPQDQLPSNQAKVQAFLHQNGPMSYAVEGTPVDMSRCTSLSNLTMDSGPDSCEFGALQRKIAERRKNAPQTDSTLEVIEKREETVMVESDKKVNIKTTETSEPRAGDNKSKEILEDLDKQIQCLTVDTATSRAGYVTSLPVGDEIKRFHVEGSVGAFTNFSALTVDSDTKITPCKPQSGHQAPAASAPKLPVDGVKEQPAELDFFEEAFEEAAEEVQVVPDPSRHYGEERTAPRDRPLCYKIEDTPLNLSGNSSLSSIDIDSDDDDNLLKDCISSAMPVARRDPAAAIPPNQLTLYQQTVPAPQGAPWDYTSRPSDKQPQRANTNNSHRPITDISPLSLASLSPADPISAAFTVSSAGNTLTGDSYYRLDRQESPDESLNSEGSISIGVDAASLMKAKKKARPKITKSPAGGADVASEGRKSVVKGGKKIYRSPITGKPRENLRFGLKDSASTSSSSNQCRDSHSRSRNSKSPCNKCHPARSRHMPQSASTGKLTEVSPGRQRRKTASSAHSKITNPDLVRKAVRSRSAHTGYHSSVTQLYPPVKGINSAMWSGLASIAARGELVVAQHDGQMAQVVPVTIGGARPVLIKQGTFIQDEPSPVLMQTVRNTGKKPKKGESAIGKQSTKKGNDTTSKSSNVWRGLKKLLSPSEETKSHPQQKPSPGKKRQPTKVSASKDVSGGSGRQCFDSGTWTKNKKRDPKTPVITKEPPKSKSADAIRQQPSTSLVLGSSSSQASSLSLSSSNSGADRPGGGRDEEEDYFKNTTPCKSIYPTERTIRPSQHVPKSPSPRNRIIVGKSPPSQPRAAGNSSWRRTPTPEGGAKKTQDRKISAESSSSATSASVDHRRSGKIPKSRLGSQTSVATWSCGERAHKSTRGIASPGQISRARALMEEVENSARANPDDVNHLFSPRRRVVVQEVAPFNYRPTPKQLEARLRNEDCAKHDPNRKQTTV